MIIPVPVIAFPVALIGVLFFAGGTTFWGYTHGVSVQEARQTKAELVQARKDFVDWKKNEDKANAASTKFEEQKPQIIREVHERTRTITIPPDADPLVPVWFVRMFDRLASKDPSADAYPGEPDGSASRIRLSGTKPVLENWVEKYETCRAQVDAIRELKPVLPQPVEESKSLFGIF